MPEATAAADTATDANNEENVSESALSAAVQDAEIPELNAKTLIEAGVHFGHSARFWDPRMKSRIFGKRNGIHVINVRETLRGAVRARHFLKQVASAGMDVLIVGTKKQAMDVVRYEAQRVGMPFVASRWLGGTLTNHSTIRRRLKRLEEIEELKGSGKFERMPKKEQARIDREHKKIAYNFEGLRNMDRLPSALMVIDSTHEKNAIAEARKLNIPVVAIVDTNSNPEVADIVIPGNDDSLRGIQIILHFLCDGVFEGRQMAEQGRGLKDKTGLQVSHYDELGPTGREKRRDKGKGGDRGRKGPGGPKSRSQGRSDDQVQQASEEAVKQADSQSGEGGAQVRVKPQAKKDGADKSAAPKAEAPKAEAKGDVKQKEEAVKKTDDSKKSDGDGVKISAKQVQALREATGFGMMEAKKALQAAGGDHDLAIKQLREAGALKQAKKSDRDTNEGLVMAAVEGGNAAVVAVLCETDFVAKNADFQEFAQKVADSVAKAGKADDIENIAFVDGGTIGEVLKNKIGTIGENLKIGDVKLLKGDGTYYGKYVHNNGKLAVLTQIKGKSNDAGEAMAKDVAMHAAFTNPIALDRDGVSKEYIESEREIYSSQIKAEGKPENMIPKIVEGKINALFKERCLLEQMFVKDNKKAIKDVVAEAKAGDLTDFAFVSIGG